MVPLFLFHNGNTFNTFSFPMWKEGVYLPREKQTCSKRKRKISF